MKTLCRQFGKTSACGLRAATDIRRCCVTDGRAQNAVQSVPKAIQGLSHNCNQPIPIEADAVEGLKKKNWGTFSSNVTGVQADTTMKAKTPCSSTI